MDVWERIGATVGLTGAVGILGSAGYAVYNISHTIYADINGSRAEHKDRKLKDAILEDIVLNWPGAALVSIG